jgi:hypothetical protein
MAASDMLLGSQMHFLRALYELRKSPEHGDRQRDTSNNAKTGGRGEEVLGSLHA